MIWGFGPAVPMPAPRDIVRGAVGAALGLFLSDVILWLLGGAGAPMMIRSALIAPFGASAFLIFSVPNSPLAQPWSAVVGNTVSALSALAVLQAHLPMVPAIAAAVFLAMVAMALTRALHPPGGAVAIATVLLARPDHLPPLSFALIPVFSGTLALVLLGMVWHRSTARHYPFRQPSTAPAQRQTPGPMALAAALDRMRMGANLGVEDLSRLIAAAEAIGAAQDLGPLTAAKVMSRDLTTLAPTTELTEAARIFRTTGFRHLPLVDGDRYVGLVPQTALLGPLPDLPLTALAETARSLGPETPLADLVTLLAEGGQTCIPVTQGGALVGLITRTDLLAALTHGPIQRQT